MKDQRGNTLVGIIIGVVIALVLGGVYYLGTQKTSNTQTSQVTSGATNTPHPINSNTQMDLYSGWKTYTSTTEKVSFKYPADWTEVKPAQQTTVPNADTLTLQSPSGVLKINWISAISGLGGGCGDKCPYFTVIDKTPILGASGLYVISAIRSDDNNVYEPWLAVQDDKGIIISGPAAGYNTFMGKHNGDGGQYGNYAAIFATSGIYAGGSQLNQADAKAFFDKPEVKQAKLILLSLTY